MTQVKERRIAAILRHALRLAPLACGLAIVVAYYAFVVGAGQPSGGWFSWSRLYDAQAEGLRIGHLHLPEEPSKALQALPDPYDPANMRFWRWDHSYYRGHFYLYWGLVPALLLAAFKAVFRVRGTIGDETLTFWLLVGRLLVGTALIRSLAARMATAPPRWAVALALAVFALAHPTPYTLARGAVYEVAILSGVFFMLAGLALAWRGLNAEAPRAVVWLAAGSLSLGCAGGCRASLLPAVVLLTIWTAYARWRVDGGGWRRLGVLLVAAGAPAAAVILLHFLLNHLRFDDWREFGARYQLGNAVRIGPRFLFVNLLTYVFLPATRACTFPFFTAPWNTTRKLLPDWVSSPQGHRTDEPVIGLFVGALFSILTVVAAISWLRGRWRRRHATVAPTVRARPWPWRWLGGALGLYVAAASLPLLLISATTMRYELDFASPLLLLAILGGWWLLSLPRTRAGTRAAGVGYAALAVVTIATGVLLGFTGYFDHFARHNPALMHGLERTLSVCGR